MRTITALALGLATFVGCERAPTQHVTSDRYAIIDPGGLASPYAVAMREKNYELAESLARDWVRESPDTSASWLALTYPLLATEQFDAAIESCEKGVSLAPKDKTLIYTRGLIAQEQGDACYDENFQAASKYYEEAILYYNKALLIDPDFPDAHYGLAAANEGLANEEEVIRHARRHLELYPDSPKKDDAMDMIKLATKYIAEQGEK